jgi:biofilm PGA synthesis N-glycosyltransferase PgaC
MEYERRLALQDLPKYVLITPARNEAQFIEATIKSVLAQSVRPARWIIVSDGSTDGTDEIVEGYAHEYNWIELIRMPERTERHFAGKAFAFKAGEARLARQSYDVIANLDADITFSEGHFSFLLGRLGADPTLGVVGTPYVETTGETYDYSFTSREHVSGACQVFRRECFEAIGGYSPIKLGAIDCIAVISARMKGWKTRTFTEQVCYHHRRTGTARQSIWKAGIATGAMDYAMGNHPLWQFFRVIYQVSRKPYISRGLGVGLGFLNASIRQEPRPVNHEFVAFNRGEQMLRLRQKFGIKIASTSAKLISSQSIKEFR